MDKSGVEISMIVPMKKILLLALAADARNALEELQKAGVMQINTAEENSDDSLRIIDDCGKAERVLSELGKYDVEVLEKPQLSGAELLEKVQNILDQRTRTVSECDTLRRRMERLEPWGDFKLETIETLKSQGLSVVLCKGNDAKFKEAMSLENLCCREISCGAGFHYFVLVGTGAVDEEKFPGLQLASDDDPALLRSSFERCEAKLENFEKELAELSRSRKALEEMIASYKSAFEFQQAVDALSEAGAVVYLTGFVPEPDIEVLRHAASANGWGLVVSDPGENENVPVLLKDNKFTRIIKPLFDFLGVLPGYREMDVAGGVLIFFTIFYAMIIGDAGYGVLFLLAALAGKWFLRGQEAARTPLNLLVSLSCATIVWGALSGSWFGIPGIPGLPWLTDAKAKDGNIQSFCFCLAFIQLALGRVWRAIHEGTFRSYVRHIGWALVIFGNFILTVKIIVAPGAFPIWLYCVYGVGLLMVMTADVNWKEPTDCFQFPFNIIGSFTDVLSYIRLFAVGLAGGCIAASFNGMGVDVIKIAPWCLPFGILAILCGHALNITLGFMSVLVHGVRLNTLEFSNHTGLSWSGQKFKPFKK